MLQTAGCHHEGGYDNRHRQYCDPWSRIRLRNYNTILLNGLESIGALQAESGGVARFQVDGRSHREHGIWSHQDLVIHIFVFTAFRFHLALNIWAVNVIGVCKELKVRARQMIVITLNGCLTDSQASVIEFVEGDHVLQNIVFQGQNVLALACLTSGHFVGDGVLPVRALDAYVVVEAQYHIAPGQNIERRRLFYSNSFSRK